MNPRDILISLDPLMQGNIHENSNQKAKNTLNYPDDICSKHISRLTYKYLKNKGIFQKKYEEVFNKT